MSTCTERPNFPMPFALWEHSIACKFNDSIRLKWCVSCGAWARVVIGVSLKHYPTCKKYNIVSVQWGPQWNDVVTCDRCQGSGKALKYTAEVKINYWEDIDVPTTPTFEHEKISCPWCWGQGKYVKCNKDKPDYTPASTYGPTKYVDWFKSIYINTEWINTYKYSITNSA